MKLRIRVENRDYDVGVEFLDDAPAAAQQEHATKTRIPASVIRERPPQKLPEDKFCLSPIAGRVTAVFVPEGRRVRKNEPVILIEAMKMENNVGPAVDGKIETIRVKTGEAVKAGQVLFELS